MGPSKVMFKLYLFRQTPLRALDCPSYCAHVLAHRSCLERSDENEGSHDHLPRRTKIFLFRDPVPSTDAFNFGQFELAQRCVTYNLQPSTCLPLTLNIQIAHSLSHRSHREYGRSRVSLGQNGSYTRFSTPAAAASNSSSPISSPVGRFRTEFQFPINTSLAKPRQQPPFSYTRGIRGMRLIPPEGRRKEGGKLLSPSAQPGPNSRHDAAQAGIFAFFPFVQQLTAPLLLRR